ncbi:MAG: hypothetical protein WCJ58_07825 [bacterium]
MQDVRQLTTEAESDISGIVSLAEKICRIGENETDIRGKQLPSEALQLNDFIIDGPLLTGNAADLQLTAREIVAHCENTFAPNTLPQGAISIATDQDPITQSKILNELQARHKLLTAPLEEQIRELRRQHDQLCDEVSPKILKGQHPNALKGQTLRHFQEKNSLRPRKIDPRLKPKFHQQFKRDWKDNSIEGQQLTRIASFKAALQNAERLQSSQMPQTN